MRSAQRMIEFQPSAAPRVRSLTVEIVRTTEGLLGLRDEWTALEQSAQVQLPFRTFAWNVAWWNTLREDKLAVRDSLELRTVRDAQTGRLVGIAPLLLTTMPGRGPLRARELQFFGADPNITEVRGVVCATQDEPEVLQALRRELLSRPDEWDWIAWEGLSATEDAPPPDGLHWRGETPNYMLRLGTSWDALRSRGSRNLKESLRKCYNSLKRDSLNHELRVASTWAEVQPALELFFQLHSARANEHHLDVFQASRSRAFLREVAYSFCQRGQMRAFVLHVGQDKVAIRLGFAIGGSLYLYYSGFDPAYAKYSVMTTCLAESIQYAIDQGFAWVDLSTGTDVSKTRWRPESVLYRSAEQVSPRLRSQIVHDGYGLARRAVEAARLGPVARKLLGRR
jgi:CelD/BcsL family acetyltransferase involved in cellulose biosynthesis